MVWLALLAGVAAGLSGCGVAAPAPMNRVLSAATGAATTPTPGPTDFGTELPANILAELPHFPPAPSPEPVVVPPGPMAGWFASIPTVAPVAFLTIDDGVVKEPMAEALLRAAHIPVTLFLDINAIRDNPLYFDRLQAVGATIEAHTITHQDLKGKSYALQI